jgi:rhodanese-related sulfurtransferase
MDAVNLSLSPQSLYRLIGGARAPMIIDLRDAASLGADDIIIVGACRQAPEDVGHWRAALPADRLVVLYDAPGGAPSREIAAQLAATGIAARWLAGGLAAWRGAGLLTRRRRAGDTGRWVTRERPRIDRIACPWLIRRFVDPAAVFLYVPAGDVAAVAEKEGATPYDVAGAAFGHVGERCSFDAFLRLYAISDAALDRLAAIVRGADTGRPELAAEAPLLLMLSDHLRARFADDHAMLERGMPVYDALYAWCRSEVADALSSGDRP